MSWKRIVLWLLFAGAAAGAAHWLPLPAGERPRQALVQPTKDERRAGGEATPQRWAALPKRDTIGAPAGELFFPHSWQPPQAQAERAAPPPAAVTKPSAPPMPYRVAGKLLHEGRPQIVLAKGDSIVTAHEGETLDDGYRVVSIRRDQVTLLYVPLGVRESIPILSTFVIDEPFAEAPAEPQPTAASDSQATLADRAEAKPAQLRWTGPQQVKAGDPFTVALKLFSGQALRAVPLQLSYDAALLEPVDVRPGKFFVGGLFSYRINPEGTIFVGASGKETGAADAELLIVTFKPIRAGATAELKISSMTLQSAAGSAIVHDEPAAFRTSIVR